MSDFPWPQGNELSEAGYECLREAVTMAKNGKAKSVAGLKRNLRQSQHSENAINEALSTWAGSVVTRLLPETE